VSENKIEADDKVHEADSNRQYIRLNVPAQVEVKEKFYDITDLSSGGLFINNIEGISFGGVIRVKLILPFKDFSMDLNISLEAMHITKEGVGFKFVDLNKEKISTINHVITAYISGDILNSADILNVMSRENFVNLRKNNNDILTDIGKNGAQLSRKISYFIIFTMGLFAALFIILNIVESIFILESNYAYVNANTIEVKASANGIYKDLIKKDISKVKKGSLIASLEGDKGEASSIISPCNCYIVNRDIKSGDYISKGSKIFTLMPNGNSSWVTVMLRPEDLSKVKLGDDVLVTIAGYSKKIRGIVKSISSKHSKNGEGIYISDSNIPNVVFIDISLSEKIPAKLITRPAKVLFLFFDFIKQREG